MPPAIGSASAVWLIPAASAGPAASAFAGGPLIDGMLETREVLDFCAGHGIACDVEMLDIRNLNDAYQRVRQGDVRYCFVIDMATLKQ